MDSRAILGCSMWRLVWCKFGVCRQKVGLGLGLVQGRFSVGIRLVYPFCGYPHNMRYWAAVQELHVKYYSRDIYIYLYTYIVNNGV